MIRHALFVKQPRRCWYADVNVQFHEEIQVNAFLAGVDIFQDPNYHKYGSTLP